MFPEEKIMKKKTAVLIALVLCFSLCLSACGKDHSNNSPESKSASAPAEKADPQPSESVGKPDVKPSESADKSDAEPSESAIDPESKTPESSGGKASDKPAAPATGSNIPAVPEYPATTTDVRPAGASAASGSNISDSSGSFSVSLASDNRYYASSEPAGVDGELTFFVEEVFWENAGLTISGTVFNNTSADVSDPVVRVFTVSNIETVISDGKLDVFAGCCVSAGSSVYWEIFIPMEFISVPFALLDTVKLDLIFG